MVSPKDKLRRRSAVEKRQPFKDESIQEIKGEETQEPKSSSTQEIMNANTNEFISICIQKPFKTKQITARLESELKKRLDDSCKANEVTRETLFEALFVYLESHPEQQEEIFSEAKQRHTMRSKLGVRRRAQAMLED